MPVIGGVDREFGSLERDRTAIDGEQELTPGMHEDTRAVAARQDQAQLRAIDQKPCGKLVAPRLEETVERIGVGVAVPRADREDCPDRHVGIDVGRSVERIDRQRERSRSVDQYRLVQFLRSVERDRRIGERGEKAVVGQ